MNTQVSFYICPYCFNSAESEQQCHQHTMRRFDPLALGDEQLKPPQDDAGRLKARAPRWFLVWLEEDRAV